MTTATPDTIDHRLADLFVAKSFLERATIELRQARNIPPDHPNHAIYIDRYREDLTDLLRILNREFPK